MSYQQLTQEKRYQICLGLRMKMRKSEIAREIGVHRSTVTRELRRNESGRWKYNPSRAIRMAKERHERKRKYRIDAVAWATIEERLKMGWSPEQISERFKREKLMKREPRDDLSTYLPG